MGLPTNLPYSHHSCLGPGDRSQNAILIHRDMKKHRHTIISFAFLTGGATLLATILHGVETALWAVAYCALGALPDFKAAMPYSLGAMTTYGHQNLYLEHWRLIGTIEALNGWLLFGLSTAFLFGSFRKSRRNIVLNHELSSWQQNEERS